MIDDAHRRDSLPRWLRRRRGPVTTSGTASNPTNLQTDTWHPATYAGTWATSGSGALQYKMMVDNSVWIHGRINNSANQVSGNTITTLPSGYFNSTRNTHTWATCSVANTNTVMPMELNTSGASQILNPYITGTNVIVNVRIPLDIT